MIEELICLFLSYYMINLNSCIQHLNNISVFLAVLMDIEVTNRPEAYLLSTTIDRHLIILMNDDLNNEFMSRYRMSQNSFFKLRDVVKSSKWLKAHGWSLEIELLVFIRWIGSGSTILTISDCYDVPRSTIQDSVDRILEIVYKLGKKVLRPPTNEEKLREIAAGFEQMSKSRIFNNCVGALDGTLIKFKSPVIRGCEFIDRNGTFSLNLSAICDHKARFLWITTGRSGIHHDARIFKESYLIQNGIFPKKPYYIVSDSAYPNMSNPIINIPVFKRARGQQTLTVEQKKFNRILSRMRVTIERAFGLLKNRWRLLNETIRVTTVTKSTKIITAACVLHNLCINDANDFESMLQEEQCNQNQTNVQIVEQEIETTLDNSVSEEVLIGQDIREELCNALKNSNFDWSQFELEF